MFVSLFSSWENIFLLQKKIFEIQWHRLTDWQLVREIERKSRSVKWLFCVVWNSAYIYVCLLVNKNRVKGWKVYKHFTSYLGRYILLVAKIYFATKYKSWQKDHLKATKRNRSSKPLLQIELLRHPSNWPFIPFATVCE